MFLQITVRVCAPWTKHWCLLIFCLADLVENFDEASKNEANWCFIPPLAVLLFATVIRDSLRAIPCLEACERCRASFLRTWTGQVTSWSNTVRSSRSHEAVWNTPGTKGSSFFQGSFNILANYRFSIIAVLIWVGMLPLITSVCCFEIWGVETQPAQQTKLSYLIMWWMCRSQLVQCFGVVKLCVWWVSTFEDVRPTETDSHSRPITNSYEYS